MILLLQRVLESSVTIENKVHGEIGHGLLVFFCAEDGDSEEKIKYVVDKTINLRIFDDENGKMSKSVLDIGGDILIISQFTLAGDTKKGRRPDFTQAAKPEIAIKLYEKYIEEIKNNISGRVATGIFAADMKVSLINDGPVTMIIRR